MRYRTIKRVAARTATAGKRRLGRDDWIAAAFDAISDGGLRTVAVEPLAARLGVTKGSFYAHFSSRDELIDATLHSWEQYLTGPALAEFTKIPDPATRLRALLHAAVTYSQSGSPSVHMSLLGELRDPRVRDAVTRVSTARLDLLTTTYRQLGLSPRRASDRARMTYATYLGLLQMTREAPDRTLSARDISRFIDELTTALTTSA
jgi:AcrR family transcriptional regulator